MQTFMRLIFVVCLSHKRILTTNISQITVLQSYMSINAMNVPDCNVSEIIASPVSKIALHYCTCRTHPPGGQ